jgi:hypothetical protein
VELIDRTLKLRSSIKGKFPMSTDESTGSPTNNSASLSLDTWAVIAALVLALAVRFDILKNVPW